MFHIRAFDRSGKKFPEFKRLRWQLRSIFLCLLFSIVFTGCAPSEEEEELVVMEQEEEIIPYNLAVVSYGDVLLTEILSGTFREQGGLTHSHLGNPQAYSVPPGLSFVVCRVGLF